MFATRARSHTDGSEKERGDGRQQSQRGQIAQTGGDGRGHIVRIDVIAMRKNNHQSHDDAQDEASQRCRHDGGGTD